MFGRWVRKLQWLSTIACSICIGSKLSFFSRICYTVIKQFGELWLFSSLLSSSFGRSWEKCEYLSDWGRGTEWSKAFVLYVIWLSSEAWQRGSETAFTTYSCTCPLTFPRQNQHKKINSRLKINFQSKISTFGRPKVAWICFSFSKERMIIPQAN